MLDEIVSLLEFHGKLRQWIFPGSTVSRLGGLTNQNYLIDGQFVLRVPGKGTNEYINRENEYVAATLTAELGVNAPLLYFDPITGVQLCKFIEEAITMDPIRFKDPQTIVRAAKSFKKVHESKRLFNNRFELFQMIDQYLNFLLSKHSLLPAGFMEVKKETESVRTALARYPLPLSPCHCDPLAENFLDTPNQSYLIDWEYSGNNDPMWDLGDLSVEAKFNDEQDEILLSAYFETEKVDPFDRGRMVLYKATCDLLWTLWGVIQHHNQNPAEDFWTYSLKRFNRCKALMESSCFPEHVRAVTEGPSKLPA